MLEEITENKINIGKHDISYVKAGHGAHVVLCMPGTLGSSWTDFTPQINGFDREKFTLIAWDPPGYGKSRPPEREFSINFYGQDVDIAFEFMKALQIPKFSLMGWCSGAVTSIYLAAKHPEAVYKMIVWGARSFLLKHELDFFKEHKDITTWPERTLKAKTELYGKEKLSMLWLNVVDSLESIYQSNNHTIIDAELLKKVSCPTFILHGEKDPIISKEHPFHLHKNIKGSRIHFYTEGRHSIHLNFAEDFNQKAQEFLLQN